MKKLLYVVIVCQMILGLEVGLAKAEIRTVDNPKYVHQVSDMDQKIFNGHNACGPTTATMLVQFHKCQQIPSIYSGRHVYSPYIALPDKSGNYYDNKTAMDMDKYEVHRHSVKGAHGFIIR